MALHFGRNVDGRIWDCLGWFVEICGMDVESCLLFPTTECPVNLSTAIKHETPRSNWKRTGLNALNVAAQNGQEPCNRKDRNENEKNPSNQHHASFHPRAFFAACLVGLINGRQYKLSALPTKLSRCRWAIHQESKQFSMLCACCVRKPHRSQHSLLRGLAWDVVDGAVRRFEDRQVHPVNPLRMNLLFCLSQYLFLIPFSPSILTSDKAQRPPPHIMSRARHWAKPLQVPSLALASHTSPSAELQGLRSLVLHRRWDSYARPNQSPHVPSSLEGTEQTCFLHGFTIKIIQCWGSGEASDFGGFTCLRWKPYCQILISLLPHNVMFVELKTVCWSILRCHMLSFTLESKQTFIPSPSPSQPSWLLKLKSVYV